MCGLAGIFLGTSVRSEADLGHLAGLFTRLLAMSEIRGTHASGAAVLDRSGRHLTFKRPVAASRLVREAGYRQVLDRVGTETTLLMGHARWATRGDPKDNSNNHPLLVGDVIGTHNGTIWNADELFKRYGFERSAQVDSELLVRFANGSLREGAIDDAELLAGLLPCRGQMSAAFVSRLDPGRLLLFRGNNPLQARYDERRRALIYASEALFLDAVLAGESGWRVLPLPAMHYLDVRAEDPGDAIPRAFQFLAEGRGLAPAYSNANAASQSEPWTRAEGGVPPVSRKRRETSLKAAPLPRIGKRPATTVSKQPPRKKRGRVRAEESAAARARGSDTNSKGDQG